MSQNAKPPFSADQIRDATHPGRTYTWRIETPDGVILRRTSFVAVDAQGADLESMMLNETGAPLGETEPGRATWKQFEGHATYPLSFTTITEDTLDTAVGTRACWLYTVTSAEDGVTKAWFAKTLPGAPVLHVVEKEGLVVQKMRLVAYDAGQPTAG